MNIAVRTDDRFVKVDGRNIRYLEEGSGVPAILLHGSSLGSSADVFRRNLHPQLVAKALFGVLDEMVTSWVLSDKEYALADQADSVADLVLNGLL